MTNIQLDQILAESRRNNLKKKLTGLLCYGGTSFIQILEGPENEVINIYSNIIKDERHHGCRILDIHITDKRVFEKWAMAYVHSSKDDFDQLSAVLMGTTKKYQQAANEVADLLKKYLGKKLNADK